MSKIPDYFKSIEFKMCTPACDKSDMNERFYNRLNSARHMAGVPFILNSAFRTSTWDREKGRSGTSYHCSGRAVDIRCNDSYSRAKIVTAAICCGLNGIGIADTFIHLDDRDVPCIWLYD